jgi:hypothetical protein
MLPHEIIEGNSELIGIGTAAVIFNSDAAIM